MTDIHMSDGHTLTTDHAASSYHIPVLVIAGDNAAYGPADVLPSGQPASDYVLAWLAETHAEAQKFLGPIR